MTTRFELFHEIAHSDSARARRFVVDKGLEQSVRFRNLAYDEVREDFAARGGETVPALWDGHILAQGVQAVVERLERVLSSATSR
ncbi:MAG: hypothetical protein ACKVPX_17040 [Myxococcaceae bacterium]